MIVSFMRISNTAFYEKVITRANSDGSYSCHVKPTGRDHTPTLSISDDMPESGGGGDAGGAAPEVAASDDDDGGDDDGEPARPCPHSNSKPSPTPALRSASKKHPDSNQCRTRQLAEPPPEFKLAVGEYAIALAIGMSVDFLRKDRSGKRIIPFFRIGKAIRYNPQRVNEALQAIEEGGHKPPKPKAKKSVNSLIAG